MNKPKRKNQPRNRILYWWNEFLFARPFEIETDLPPDECAERLLELGEEPTGCLNTTSVTTDVYHIEDGVYDFDVRAKRRSGILNYTRAKVTGRLLTNGATNMTLVHGEAKLGWLYYASLCISLIIWVLYMIVLFMVLFPLQIPLSVCFTLFLVLTGCYITYEQWVIFRTRNALLDLICDTLTGDKRKAKS